MSPLWLSLHLIGFTGWIGGLLALFALDRGSAREGPDLRGSFTRARGAVYRLLVGPGAMLTVVSGMILTLQLYGEATSVGLSHALMTMQGLGLVAALLSLIVSVPTASRLGRLEPTGPSERLFAQLAARLRVSDMVTLGLGLIALVAGTM